MADGQAGLPARTQQNAYAQDTTGQPAIIIQLPGDARICAARFCDMPAVHILVWALLETGDVGVEDVCAGHGRLLAGYQSCVLLPHDTPLPDAVLIRRARMAVERVRRMRQAQAQAAMRRPTGVRFVFNAGQATTNTTTSATYGMRMQGPWA